MVQYNDLRRLPRTILIRCIGLYQSTLSPDHGWLKVFYPDGCCIHAETCSQYAKRMLAERGLIVGFLLSVRRVVACNPWSTPDPERVMERLRGSTRG